MRLSAAARYFDRLVCRDAFNPRSTFKAQMDVYDDSKRDGTTVARRVLSVAPCVRIPARRIIEIAGAYWIVGADQTDYFLEFPLRVKYVIQRAHGVATVRTVAQALSSGGRQTYAGKIWIKDTKEVEVSSKFSPFYNIYLSTAESVAIGNLIELAGRQYLVRNTLLSAAGFLVAESTELPLDALGVGSYKVMTYSPEDDERVVSSVTAVNLLKIRFQDFFAYEEQAQEKFQEGDLRVLIRSADVPAARPGDLITANGEDWEILSAVPEDGGDCWGLHLRHAGS